MHSGNDLCFRDHKPRSRIGPISDPHQKPGKDRAHENFKTKSRLYLLRVVALAISIFPSISETSPPSFSRRFFSHSHHARAFPKLYSSYPFIHLQKSSATKFTTSEANAPDEERADIRIVSIACPVTSKRMLFMALLTITAEDDHFGKDSKNLSLTLRLHSFRKSPINSPERNADMRSRIIRC